ncbi:hypothetical protein ACFU7X_23255 [Streptomyces chartreusis]|uniref:hypothetical protein n=1 Tax=Streptomyces chartreusis TaxID=1969 RepID=UPI0036BC0C7F
MNVPTLKVGQSARVTVSISPGSAMYVHFPAGGGGIEMVPGTLSCPVGWTASGVGCAPPGGNSKQHSGGQMSVTVRNKELYGTYDRSDTYGGLAVNRGFGSPVGKGYRFRVNGDDPAGQVESLQKVSGDNREGYPGTQLSPVPEVKALDKSGNPIKDITVKFTIDPKGTGSSFINGQLTDERKTDDRGQSWSTYLKAGPTVGPFTVTASAGSRSVVFNERVKALPQVPPAPVITFPAEGATVYDPRPTILGTGVPGAMLTLSYPGGAPISVQIPANGQWSVTPASDLAAGPVTLTAVQATTDGSSPQARRTFTVVAPASYEVAPGGPPDVLLTPGGPAGYPGVVVTNTGEATIGERTVTVVLPAGTGLQWGVAGRPDHQLTVLDVGVYPGALSPDGSTLTFDGVNLNAPANGQNVLWVGVSATADALPGDTALHFTVGDHASTSTPVRISGSVISPPVSVEPGGPPDVLLEQGGPTGYPGVKLANNGNAPVAPLTVTVALPQDTQLRWGQPGDPDHQLTVLDAQGTTTVYVGALSDDGQSLTFEGVDPRLSGLGSSSVLWVAVSAAADAAPVSTSLLFSVGDQASGSTPVNVLPAPAD